LPPSVTLVTAAGAHPTYAHSLVCSAYPLAFSRRRARELCHGCEYSLPNSATGERSLLPAIVAHSEVCLLQLSDDLFVACAIELNGLRNVLSANLAVRGESGRNYCCFELSI